MDHHDTTTAAPLRRSRGRPPGKERAPRPDHVEPLDLHIGHRIRCARGLRNVSRRTLAQKLGLGMQAIEKYETGLTRILASRLHDVARILDVPITFFYDEFDPRQPADADQFAALCRALTEDNVRLLRSLDKLTRAQMQTVVQMVEGLAQAGGIDERAAGAA